MPKALPVHPRPVTMARPIRRPIDGITSLRSQGTVDVSRFRAGDTLTLKPNTPASLPQLSIQATRTTVNQASPTAVRPMTLPSLAVAAATESEPLTHPVSNAQLQARRLPMDMDLPGQVSPKRFGLVRRMKKHGWKPALAVGLVIIMTLGGLVVSQSYLKLHKVFKGSAGTAAALKANVDPNLLKGEGSGRVNILLMGRGGGTHDGPDLTDSMMLVSIDPINHTSTLLSLPRDLWVNVPNQGVMKLNAAWETGEFKYEGKITPGSTDPKAIAAGFKTVDDTVHSILGIDINYNLLVDFQAFQQAVNTVGGVNVNVPEDLVDPTMAWANKGDPVLAKAGIQDFNGDKALMYVRSRETSSDFARGERQRLVLVALKNKVETLGTLSNPLKIGGLFNTFGNNVNTDLSIGNAQRLYGIEKNITAANIKSIDLDGTSDPNSRFVTTGNMNGQSIVLPTEGLFHYGSIQQFVRNQLKDPYIIKENAKITVLNGTNIPGLASSTGDVLKGYGYNVIKVGNSPDTGWTGTTVIDLSNGKDKYTRHYLEQHFNVKVVTNLAGTTIPANGSDFVIIIGSDETSTAQTQAN